MDISAVIVAAGSGSRMGAGFNKVYMPLLGKPVLNHTVKAFIDSGAFCEIVIVTARDDFDRAKQILSEFDADFKIVEGGKTRQESVLNGIEMASGDMVAVHDGARALITPKLLRNALENAEKFGATALGVKPKDTLKLADSSGFIRETVSRETAYQIQTPQVFNKKTLIEAHKKAIDDGFFATDDCMLAEREGIKIKITEGSYENIKLTTPEDIFTAERILKERTECE